MSDKRSAHMGCLLGLAVGDAMGFPVDKKTWEEICDEYGPNGLLGYDLRNGSAEVSSHTQIAAYVGNALLVALTRGRPGAYVQYITMALKEWAKRQHFPRDPDKSPFWVSQLPELRKRACMDARMLDALRAETLGETEHAINNAVSPGSLPAAVAISLFYNPKRMEPSEVGTLAADTLALTHGNPETFLSGVVLAYALAGIIQQPEYTLEDQFRHACSAMQAQFGFRFPQGDLVEQRIMRAIDMANSDQFTPLACMERLDCCTAPSCVAGAFYACLKNPDDFDAAMILAVNHSGSSAAVGALVGAILGAKMGREALPDFYLESLEAVEHLEQLATDLATGSMTTGLFNDDWDHRYVQGLPSC